MAERYVYAPGQVFDSLKSFNQMMEQMKAAGHNSSPADFRKWPKDLQEERGIYPTRFVGSMPAPHYREGEPVNDGLQPDGYWQFTRTWTAAPLDQVKASAKKRVDAWKKAKQDEPFTHSDTKQYDNTERDRINLNGAVQLAVLESLTNRPGPPTPPMAYKAVAKDGTVTVMDKDAVTALGLSALAHMQSIQDQALQAQSDIDGALTDDEVLAIVDQLTAVEEEPV